MTWQDEVWKHMPDLPMASALEVAIQDLRVRATEAHGWWVLYPDWMWEHRERIKVRWVHVHAGHPFGDLRGFYFLDQPGRIGQKFTYDQMTGEWDR